MCQHMYTSFSSHNMTTEAPGCKGVSVQLYHNGDNHHSFTKFSEGVQGQISMEEYTLLLQDTQGLIPDPEPRCANEAVCHQRTH